MRNGLVGKYSEVSILHSASCIHTFIVMPTREENEGCEYTIISPVSEEEIFVTLC